MEKKKIKIKYVDFWPGFDQETHLFTQLLRERYDIEFSDNPDYVIYSVFGINNYDYLDKVRIFFTGEDVCPDFNDCDYGFGFEHVNFPGRYFRFPLFYGYGDNLLNALTHRHETAPLQPERAKFASIVISNSKAKERVRFFQMLSNYKHVDSGGRYLNNIGKPNGVENKFDFDSEHKFTICFENERHPGYTTEKLAQAFYAGCIPIYWGDPCVGEVFNEKAFINVGNYDSFDDVIQKVIEIDQNDTLYRQMLAEPVFLHKEDYPENKLNELRAFFSMIFDKPYNEAYQRPYLLKWGIYKYIPAIRTLDKITHDNFLYAYPAIRCFTKIYIKFEWLFNGMRVIRRKIRGLFCKNPKKIDDNSHSQDERNV